MTTFSHAATMFRVGDAVTATQGSFFGDEYAEGDQGIVVDIRDGGLIIARKFGGLIRSPRTGQPFVCDSRNWE